jgi:peptidoglycan/xylan/chitin deacetylase (PgdA/CDA1 family)
VFHRRQIVSRVVVNSLELVKDAVSAIASILGLTSPRRYLHGRLLVLTFHRVLPKDLRAQYPYPGLAVTPEELSWILQRFLPLVRLTTVSEALSLMEETDGRAKVAAVTFDDGQWDNLEYAAPVLAREGARATFYLPTEAVESGDALWHDTVGFAWQRVLANRPDQVSALMGSTATRLSSAAEFAELLKGLGPEKRSGVLEKIRSFADATPPSWARQMTWHEVGQLAKLHHELGSHTVSHPLLTQLSADAVMWELEESKRIIECKTGQTVRSLCYPNGDCDARVASIAESCGYRNAVTTRWGLNGSGENSFMLRRCDMSAQHLLDRNGRLSRTRLDFRISGLSPRLPK